MTQEYIPLQHNEEIVPIQGYENLYSITSFGRVWSHKRFRHTRWCGGVFKKPSINKDGYCQIVLFKDGLKKTFLIHQLVALVYIDNILGLLDINHKDTNKLNNHKNNLEWCTKLDNINHAIDNGLFRKESSIFRGVCFHKRDHYKNHPWKVQINHLGKHKWVGDFKTEIEAAKAYNDYVIKYGLNRPLNNIEGVSDL